MRSNTYFAFGFLYFAFIMGMACLCQWASFMHPFVVWTWHHDTETGLIMLAACLPMLAFVILWNRAWQREQRDWMNGKS